MSSHLSTTYRRQITWNGYPADVMKSGLQKYIRRGMIEKALYCAGELDLFKEAPDAGQGEGIRTNFLHRLMVIYMEDVENLALWPDMTQKMKELFAEREKANRDKAKEERLISEVVIQMGASTKARVLHHIRAVFNPRYKPIHDSYPSIRVLWDEIEQNNKEKTLETLEHNCKLYSKYVKEKNILAVYYGFQIDMSEEKLKEKILKSSKPVWYLFQQLLNPMDQRFSTMVSKFIEWYKEHIGTLNESFLCWLLPLLHHLEVIPQGELPNVDFGSYPMNWDQHREGVKIEVDDYVLDRHTAKGRGKGMLEFALQGSVVENQAPFVNPLWKQFYEDGKRMEEGIPILGEKALSALVPNSSKRKKPIAGPIEEERVDNVPPVAPRPPIAPPGVQKESIKPEISISIMNDNFVFIDNVYRSRMTLLDILEKRGYDVEKYRKFSPAEAKEAVHSFPSLSFVVSKKEDATQICDVRYANLTNPKLETYFKENVADEDSERTEMIVMMEGPVTDRHHATALKQYLSMKEEPNENGERIRRKLRVSFFCIELLVINPLNHVLVPKHELVPDSEHKKLMDSMYITAKSKFPEIKFHVDPIARCIGAIPGDIVKITRASASAGESIIYRVCAP